MNEKPEETPNPLNANPEPNNNMLDANPAEPLHETMTAEESVVTASRANDEMGTESAIKAETISQQEADEGWPRMPEQPRVSEQPSTAGQSRTMEQSRVAERPMVEGRPAASSLREQVAERNNVEAERGTPTKRNIPVLQDTSAEQSAPVEQDTSVGQDIPAGQMSGYGTPEGQPMPNEEVVMTEQIITAAPVESLDPTGRPMEQAVNAADLPVKKKKTGLVFGIIGGILVLAGIAAAIVAVVLMMNKPDPVTMAIQRIMSGEAPNNVAIDGNIDILPNNTESPIKRINIDLDSDIVVGSMINTSSAVLTFTNQNDQDFSVKFEEVYAAEGDLFFKIEGAMAALEDSGILAAFNASNVQTTNCVEDESGATNCIPSDCNAEDEQDCASEVVVEAGTMDPAITNTVLSVVEAADGVYLRVAAQDLDSASQTALRDTPASCITDLISDINKDSKSAADLYSKYPFIKASDKNAIISSKQNTVYSVSVDSKNLTDYINNIRNAQIRNDIYTCLGLQDNVGVTEADITDVIKKIPAFYAEVNSDYNFTRLYFESVIGDDLATATVDLGISYPANVTVTEPVEYTDFSDMVQTIFTTMYNIQPNETPNAE